MAVFFWADTHFNHTGIIEHCHRPFETTEAMNESIIAKWNQIEDKDTIFFLGDFGFEKKGVQPLSEIFTQLKGHKHLIVGNHDEQNPRILGLKWESVSWYKKVKHEGMRAIASHYPFETWSGVLRGYIHVHGHSHGTLRRKLSRRFDVGVDVYQAGPVLLDYLIEKAKEQTFVPTDHHGDI